MDLDLSNKVALITGGSMGIGRAAAILLAKEGCNVLLVARNRAKLETTAAEIRTVATVSVRTMPADLSLPAEVERLATQIEHLDILINNAGAVPPGTLAEINDTQWRQGWDLKVLGYIGMTRAFYPHLRASRGVVINIIGGERNDPNFIVSAVGGAALCAFTRALGKSASVDGIRIVGINPGLVATGRGERFLRARALAESGDEGRWRDYHQKLPFGRPASVEEIASTVAFLASPRSGYTNGIILTIDGAPK